MRLLPACAYSSRHVCGCVYAYLTNTYSAGIVRASSYIDKAAGLRPYGKQNRAIVAGEVVLGHFRQAPGAPADRTRRRSATVFAPRVARQAPHIAPRARHRRAVQPPCVCADPPCSTCCGMPRPAGDVNGDCVVDMVCGQRTLG